MATPFVDDDFLELPVYGVRSLDRKWAIDFITSELNRGQFLSAAKQADAMLRDARILGAFEQRMAGLFGSPFEMIPADESSRAVKVAEEIEADWNRLFPREDLEDLLTSAIFNGVSLARIHWSKDIDGFDTFRLETIHTQFLTWRWDTMSYWVTLREGPYVNTAENKDEWLTFTPYGYKRAYLKGRLRALMDPFMSRGWANTDWGSYNEIYGRPPRLATIPQQSDPKQEKEFVSSISKMSANSVVKLRKDKDGNEYGVELLKTDSGAYKTFKDGLDFSGAEICRIILGQSMSTDGVGGLGAQEKPGDAVRSDIKAADNFKLCETIREQCLKKYVETKYGDPKLTPRPNYQVDPPEDETKTSLALKTIADALVSFKASGAPVNQRQLLEEQSIPLLTEEEEATMKAEADAKDAADQQSQRDHELALTAAKGGGQNGPPKDDKAKALHTVSDALKNFAMAGAAVDTPAILTEHGIPHVDSED